MSRGNRQFKTDANHSIIVDALRKAGFSVQSLASVGAGCPDAVVGASGLNILLEIKDGDAIPSRQRLTEDEDRFRKSWFGQVETVNSPESAISAVNEILKQWGQS